MKNIYITFLLVTLSMLQFNCSKYDPIFGVADYTNIRPPDANNDVVYLYNNDVYLTDHAFENHQQLTTDQSSKSHICMNLFHNKVAFLDEQQKPVIIDNAGNTIERLDPLTGSGDLGWYDHDNESFLYILNADSLYTHESSFNFEAGIFDFVFPPDADFKVVDAVHVRADKSVFFTYRYQKPYSITSPYRSCFYGAAINYSDIFTLDYSYEQLNLIYLPTDEDYDTLPFVKFYDIQFNETDSSIILGRINNGQEMDIAAYSIQNLNTTTNTLNNINTSLQNVTAYFEKKAGILEGNNLGVQLFYYILPNNIPINNNSNTYNYSFDGINNQLQNFMDWKP